MAHSREFALAKASGQICEACPYCRARQVCVWQGLRPPSKIRSYRLLVAQTPCLSEMGMNPQGLNGWYGAQGKQMVSRVLKSLGFEAELVATLEIKREKLEAAEAS